jgi:hypothetical protein
MAILRSGILGHTSGKVAGVVGGKWKNKSYIREFVIPANPNTTPQQVQRGKMRDCVAFAKALVGQIFNTYGDKFQKGMSGFNYFIQQNIALFDGSPTWASIKVTFGKLWQATILTVVKVSGTCTITWDPASLGNNGAATDAVYACAYRLTTGLWYFATAEVARSTGTIDITVPVSSGGGDYLFFLFAAKYSVTSPTLLEMVSDSSAQAGTT